MRKTSSRLLVVGVALCIGAAGLEARAFATNSSLEQVKVVGAQPTEPRLRFARPFSAATTSTRVVEAGTGPVVAVGQRVTFRFAMVDGRTGKDIPSSYGWNPANVLLDPTTTDHLFVDALSGQAVGARVLVAAASKEPYVKNMVGGKGVKRGDTVFMLFDVVDVHTPLTAATGSPGASVPADLPSVDAAGGGAPFVTMPPGGPPPDLQSVTLVRGDGPKLDVGQNVLVHYEGVNWRTGDTFDSTWRSGKPLEVPLGVGQVMTGWDNGLIGQTVGSRVLLVVPPSQGYGTQGNARAGIEGDDTLVFVIDILDAWT